MKLFPAFLLALSCLFFFTPKSHCQGTDGWPRTFTNDGIAFTIYQPQVTAWSGNVLTSRAAISVLPQGAAEPQFGTLVLSATTDVDNVQQTVSLSDITVVQSNFPSASDQASAYASLIATQASQWAQNLSLPAVKANLAVASAEGAGTKTVAVQNNPPTIYFSESSAVLVLVDGPPALRPVSNTTLLRIINTQALLVMDQSSGLFYLRINSSWMQATGTDGPWIPAENPPDTLDNVLQQATSAGNVQLFNEPEGTTPPPTPNVYVSTTPAELITTQGVPTFEPVNGTQLLHVTNSGSSIFMNVANQTYYVVISGRWFSSASLTGPWQFVPANQLPADFAKIPESAPAGAVLASVAGTSQAGEAAISSTIPQTAAISRTTTTTVTYDGDPQFEKIADTNLFYAKNTPHPVIQVPDGKFYTVVNGVWFKSDSATGPWKVADKVPEEIYTIPPSSPVYYATNVYVYNSTPDVVYTGYTPGYYGAFLAPEGVVVFGTGYNYQPYFGESVWYGPPLTYGFGAGFACGLTTGLAFGLAVDHGWGCCPWWGPWNGGWGNYNVNRDVTNNWNNVNVNNYNAYNRWGDNVVSNQNITNDRNQIANWRYNHIAADNAIDRQRLRNDARLGDNNVFAGQDGNIYRSDADGNWQRRDAANWVDVNRHFDNAARSDLDAHRYARSVGVYRSGGGRR